MLFLILSANVFTLKNKVNYLLALGALDCTLVHAVIQKDIQVPYRGRGMEECYQNILALRDFHMAFTYVCARCEGAAYDSRVLTENVSDKQFSVPTTTV